MIYDVVIIGGGPSGATAAIELATLNRRVALIDRDGRIKPCGGAVPPRLIKDFEIPDRQIVAKIKTARMISPTARTVDIPIENGYVGMVERENFDEFLRARAKKAGAHRFTGTFLRITRDSQKNLANVVFREKTTRKEVTLETKLIIGADGARSDVARAEIPGGKTIPYVIAYHEIIEAPENGLYDPDRCDVIYNGNISPDFYGWIFPHGKSASVGMGTKENGFDLKAATARIRADSGLDHCRTIRKEGAPIPLKPLEKWDNGKDLVLAGDAAGVVAPSSGEGIYYAMIGGQEAALATHSCLLSENSKDLQLARKRFMSEHKTVFRVLEAMQNAYYKSDDRRERFVSLCKDVDVQRLTFESYMHKKLVTKRPLAHLKIMVKNLLHLSGLVRATT
ncbi:MAG: geranylgeranyl diphosphate reductase [Rhodobacteraceae bacterium]|nr:MAG: geranylgeranyl diphosphate reductase [Paracoccaceae bacterium]